MTQDKQVSFTQMKDGTREEYLMLHELEQPFHEGTADRLLRELAKQGDETLAGYKITRLEHGLQSATRAWRDGTRTTTRSGRRASTCCRMHKCPVSSPTPTAALSCGSTATSSVITWDATWQTRRGPSLP